MNSIPSSPYPLDSEGYEHPNWCDLGECTAPSALRQRGVDEAGVPLYLHDSHLTTSWVIDADRPGEAEFTVQAFRGTDQPVTDEVEGVDLVAEITLQNLRIGLPVTVEQLGPLARAFAGVRDIANSGKPPTRVDRAVRALAEFGVLDSGVAARVLPMYREYTYLTRAEVEEVIAWFVDGTDELRRAGSPDDSNSGPGWPMRGDR